MADAGLPQSWYELARVGAQVVADQRDTREGIVDGDEHLCVAAVEVGW
jgi:hypothetical protein